MASGIWNLTNRIGYAWRKAQRELYDCESDVVPELLDDLGSVLLRLGLLLQPPLQGSPQTKLANARTDVKHLVACLEKVASPSSRADVWDQPAPTTTFVQWPVAIVLHSCLSLASDAAS